LLVQLCILTCSQTYTFPTLPILQRPHPCFQCFRDFVYPSFIANSDIYASIRPALTQSFVNLGSLYASGSYYSITFSNATNCSSGFGALILGWAMSVDVHNVRLMGNVDTTNVASGLTLVGPLNQVNMSNLVVIGNVAKQRRGGIAVFAKGPSSSVYVQNSLLAANSAQRSGGLIIADATRLLAGLVSHLEGKSGSSNVVGSLTPLTPCMLDETTSPEAGQKAPHSSVDI